MPIPRTRVPRTEMHPAANFLAPLVIFAIAMFAVWQVNHHTQLEGMMHDIHTEGDHFVTGGREAHDESKPIVLAQQDPHTTATQTTTSTSSSLTDAKASSSSSGSGSGGGGGGGVVSQGSKVGSQGAVTAAGGGGGGRGSQVAQDEMPAVCHMEEHAEYHGDVVKWGDKNIVASADACCEECQKKAANGCNVWVYCGQENGCGNAPARPRGECWLKKSPLDTVMMQRGKGHKGISWTSGVLYTDAEYSAYLARAQDKVEQEKARLQALKARSDLPLIWLEVTLQGKLLGRMEFVLFTDISPLAAENMRRMCTGEVSSRHTLKGAKFYRIIDQFIDQTGVEVNPCALGGMFKDDPEGLKLKHDRKGLLSVANMGHDTNTGHFSILMGPAPHLNKGYVIFGEMVSGWEVALAINKLSQGRPNNELLNSPDAVISDVGETRRGTPVTEEVVKAGLVKQ